MQDVDELGEADVALWAWPLPRGAAATRSLSRVCATFFLDAFTLGVSISVLPSLARLLRCEGSLDEPARVVLALVGVLAPGTVGTAWTRLCRRVGLRFTCAVAGSCRVFGLGLLAVAGSAGGLAAGVALWGIGAGSLTLATDSVASVLPPERRPAALGLLLVAVALAMAAGANLGGLLPRTEPRLTLWVGASLSLVGIAQVLAFLPDAGRPPHAEGRRSRASGGASER